MDVLRIVKGLLILFVTVSWAQRIHVPEIERHASYWKKKGFEYLMKSVHLQKKENNAVAKNIILFLGDGMGISTVTATRIYMGQLDNKGGEDESLVFDEFPHVSLAKTYGIDRQTSDSANTATAYLCGVKANSGTLGLDGRVVFENCSSTVDLSTHVSSILKWAQDKGKWTGFVTTTRVTHATPAGLYAHSASRYWEAESPDPRCKDIAAQLIQEKPGKDIRVIMGGGWKTFVPQSGQDAYGNHGARTDFQNLIKEWEMDKKLLGKKSEVIYDAMGLRSLNADHVDYVLGLFHYDHMPFVQDREEEEIVYPTLKEMTEVAIKILSRNRKGFFLLVEGGGIDLAHHQNWAQKALAETVEFNKAVGHAVKATKKEKTLIVVTADHSHTLTLGGNYPPRGSNVLGVGGVSTVDHMTFTTLGYNNGPGYEENARGKNLTQKKVLEKDFKYTSAVPLPYATHAGEDVAVYATGPMAHLFHVHDQSYIPYAMGYASCIGPNQKHCTSGSWPLLDTSYGTFIDCVFFIVLLYIGFLF